MRVRYIRFNSLDGLRVNIATHLKYYSEPESWLDNGSGPSDWYRESNLTLPDEINLKSTGGADDDFENAKTIYTAMKGLSLAVAIDERFWAYMTHSTYWDYMRNRWPVEKSSVNKKEEFIREHYFFMTNKARALTRNGISRLWWFGHVSYDENREDPFELTKVLLKTQDVAQTLLERSFSRNEMVTKSILACLLEREKENRGNPFHREHFRTVARTLNAVGSVASLDSLAEEDITQICWEKFDQLEG
tara:strand:- start:1017 stop:1757 length:741 start_codon:yes stop_codon:yes gene_type:complete